MISLKGLSTNAKLFADDTTLFSVIHDSQTSANDLIKELEMIQNCAFQWKMNFYPDPTKQAQEVIFSCKTKNYLILPYCLIMQKLLNLSTTIGSDLTFENHLKMVTTKTEKTIELLRSSIAK